MNRRMIIGVIALTGSVIAWYALFHQPISARIATLEIRITAEEQKLADYQKSLKESAYILEQNINLQDEYDRYKIVESGTEEVIAIYSMLDSLCRQPDLELEEIAPSLEEVIKYLQQRHSGKLYAAVPIRIKIRGQYDRLADLVKTIEGLPYFERLTATRITGSERLYPQCMMQLAFSTKLGVVMEVSGLE